jgi:hypothetical protein
MAIQLYGLTITASGTTSTAFYSVNLGTSGEFVQGGATIYPTATAATLVTLYGIELQINAPAASYVGGSATLTTTGDIIAGRIAVSPPVNVDTVVTLYGLSEIGSTTVKAGDSEGTFSWNVGGKPGIADETSQAFVERMTPKKP